MKTKQVEVLDINERGEVLIDSTGLYRVIVHKADGDQIYEELVTAEDALISTQCFNGTQSSHWGEPWLEIISYREAYKRDEWDAEDERVQERLVRIQQASAEDRNRGAVRRLFTRVAAMIW